MNAITTNSDADLRTLLRLCYQKDPTLYAKHELHVKWWIKQEEIARALIQYGRVFVKAGNGPGKTFLAAGLVNWFYDNFNPGICLTTAPTASQVRDVLWKEIRVQRRGRPGLQPKAPRMESAPNHYAVGYTAISGDAFQGRHEEPLMIVFDEATGITGEYWDSAEGMQPTYWLCLLNPTDTATRAFEEEQKDSWHVITLDAFEHPNIIAELMGEPAPYPTSSLRLKWVRERVEEWCTPIQEADRRVGDKEFGGKWYRPGPLFESRVMGRWPTAGSTSVWSEAAWNEAVRSKPEDAGDTEAGCDVARFGDDFTSIVIRRGMTVLHHETHNGWDTSQTAGRLTNLKHEYGLARIKVDDDGVGGGVVDKLRENGLEGVCPVSGAHTAIVKEDYPNRRSELWFVVAERAYREDLDLSRLSADSLKLLRRQAMAPTWKLDSQGRREVEKKADTKKRIGRSPDDMDALNLAFAPPRPQSNISNLSGNVIIGGKIAGSPI